MSINADKSRKRLVILHRGKAVPPTSVEFIQISDYHLAEFKRRQDKDKKQGD